MLAASLSPSHNENNCYICSFVCSPSIDNRQVKHIQLKIKFQIFYCSVLTMSGSKPGVTGQIICAQSWVDTCNKVEVDFRFDTFCQ